MREIISKKDKLISLKNIFCKKTRKQEQMVIIKQPVFREQVRNTMRSKRLITGIIIQMKMVKKKKSQKEINIFKILEK